MKKRNTNARIPIYMLLQIFPELVEDGGNGKIKEPQLTPRKTKQV